ncbi:T9SS type A sorting domain-containing protein [Saprospiraceae bacterium]|nr:T9SS type A sorting domain-containing protein [Saprospiraceae bacterium]MDC3220004.1 T9SS type A sorting domain-containing protein [Saprospiraceae bacterium]
MKNIFTLFLAMALCGFTTAQDVIEIASGSSNAGLLETTINNDVDGNGDRLNPNRIYRLLEGIHFQLSAINVSNPNGTIFIEGATGGKKPVFIPIATNDIDPGANIINGSLSLKNIHLQGRNDIGGGLFARWEINGQNRKITAENCLMEFAQHQWFFANAVTQGLVIEMRNNYFRDLFWDDQWWASRVFEAKVPIDSLIFENNTVTGSGMALLQQEALCSYALINHNSFINNHGYVMVNNYYLEAYFTNNLYINSQIKGEDFTVASVEPDKIATCIMGLDTINTTILLPAGALNADSTALVAPYDDIANYKIYASNNIYYNEPTLDPYYSGTYNTLYDAPVSYLNWFGDGPWEVAVPTPWMNSRALALYAEWPNIVEEHTTLDTDPGLGEDAITANAADQLAIWNRILYGVPEAQGTAYDLTDYYFGDNDPSTIPGVDTEDGDGIVNFYDLLEDLSINSNFVSTLDGHTIGATHWTNEIDNFDPDASLTSILNGYADATTSVTQPINDVFELAQNLPNPFNQSTDIIFSMHKKAHVTLTIHNAYGVQVATLFEGMQNAGSHNITWDASSAAAGIYFYTLESDNIKATGKMMVVK